MIFQLGPYTAEIAKPSCTVEVERPSFDKKTMSTSARRDRVQKSYQSLQFQRGWHHFRVILAPTILHSG